MRQHAIIWAVVGLLCLTTAASAQRSGSVPPGEPNSGRRPLPASTQDRGHSVQLGPRPFFLAADMENDPLKETPLGGSEEPSKRTEFSIGHRGAPLQFPEHTLESYEAAARMGAGILECDVTFTKDLQLVCRHAQNDLHTTTNILVTSLASTCTQPFTPAEIASDGTLVRPASAE
jgi:glycerophosphoryl diester phosphodiesterase